MKKPCPVCAEEISEQAKKCFNCGSFQKKGMRKLSNVVKFFSGVTIFITAVTLCVSFFPSAYESIFYSDDLEIYSIKTRISGGQGLITFENKGDGDIFINEVSFHASDTIYNIKPRNIIINQWIKKSEVLSLPYKGFVTSPNYQSWTYATPEKFLKIKSILPDSIFTKARNFYRLEIFDEEYNDAPFPGLIDGIKLQSKIRFSSHRSDGLQIKISKKELTGLIRENESAINRFIDKN